MGAQGPAGNDGAAGPQGPAGNDGTNGTTGLTGPVGAQGPAGVDGTTGLTGSDGNGIASTTDNGDGTFTLTYDDGSIFTTSDLTGPAGNSSGGYKTINTLLDQIFYNNAANYNGQTVSGSVTSVASNNFKMICKPSPRATWYDFTVIAYDSNNNVLNLYFEESWYFSVNNTAGHSYLQNRISNNTAYSRQIYASSGGNSATLAEPNTCQLVVDVWADGIIDHIDYTIDPYASYANNGPYAFNLKLYTFN